MGSIITTMPQPSMARSQDSKIGSALWVGWMTLLSPLSIRTLANSMCLEAPCMDGPIRVFSCIMVFLKDVVAGVTMR